MKERLYRYLQLLPKAFPHSEIEGETLTLYANLLKDFDENLVCYIIRHWVLTQKEPPPIAALRENCELVSGWIKTNREG